MPKIGLVTDGIFDLRAVSVLVRKCAQGVTVESRQCGGGRKNSKALGIIREFDRRRLVDFVLWVTDAESDNPTAAEIFMKNALARVSGFSLEVRCVVAVPMLEAWPVADENAVRQVRGASQFFRHPERLTNPKRELRRLLGGRLYTPPVAERIADAADIGILAKRCKSFRALRQAVTRS